MELQVASPVSPTSGTGNPDFNQQHPAVDEEESDDILCLRWRTSRYCLPAKMILLVLLRNSEIKDMANIDIEELRAALLETQRARDDAVHREGELRLQLTQLNHGAAVNTPVCYFFDKFPREMRDRIYKYLLVNLDLSTTKFLKGWGKDREKVDIDKFELSPQILRVCRQAHNEGILILYTSNKFIIEFVTMNARPLPSNSPIFRHPLHKGLFPRHIPETKACRIFPVGQKSEALESYPDGKSTRKGVCI
ncbi:hypothetical protein N431DRAFT_465920 [Stipitochalara longipes BDJ]|nr:hypothetical protein N431DRAFT_465920 [Stipitochalara longipes BDJ]